MKRNIDRRTFIGGSAFASMMLTSKMVGAFSSLVEQVDKGEGTKPDIPSSNKETTSYIEDLTYNRSGKFKILQLTDTHYIEGDARSVRALDNVNKLLDMEKPDLVIHTGDIIFGNPAEDSLRRILEPISVRKIPFAVTFGNHDEEFDKTREEMLEIVQSIPYNITLNSKEIFGVTNYILTLKSFKNDAIKNIFYFFDSNALSTIKDIDGYGHIHFNQIAWYRERSKFYTKQNNGKPLPSFAFFHIPLPEHREAAIDANKGKLIGTRMESVASPKVNSGLLVSMKEMGDIQAVFVGHDHDNDFAVYWDKMFFIYGRYSGGDTVYNNLKPNGGRVIELMEGGIGFRSWIRLSGGEIIQDLQYPNDFIEFQKGT